MTVPEVLSTTVVSTVVSTVVFTVVFDIVVNVLIVVTLVLLDVAVFVESMVFWVETVAVTEVSVIMELLFVGLPVVANETAPDVPFIVVVSACVVCATMLLEPVVLEAVWSLVLAAVLVVVWSVVTELVELSEVVVSLPEVATWAPAVLKVGVVVGTSTHPTPK